METTKCQICQKIIPKYNSFIKNGKTYYHKNRLRKFCSLQCSSLSKKQDIERFCKFCGGVFIRPKHMKNKFCSQQCSSSANLNLKKSVHKKRKKPKIKYFQCIICSTSTEYTKLCNVCRIIENRIYERNRSPKKRKTINSYTKDIKLKLISIKGGCCKLCGYNKSISALTFHHIDPKEKLFCLDRAHLYKKHINEILIEVEKCDLLCFNCHMELHHG